MKWYLASLVAGIAIALGAVWRISYRSRGALALVDEALEKTVRRFADESSRKENSADAKRDARRRNISRARIDELLSKRK